MICVASFFDFRNQFRNPLFLAVFVKIHSNYLILINLNMCCVFSYVQSRSRDKSCNNIYIHEIQRILVGLRRSPTKVGARHKEKKQRENERKNQ